MARLPQHFLDDLLGRIDIVELIESRIELKRQGREYAACCPFHNEKTPSFTVSPAKQFYHCFGCGAHGNAIDFTMEYDRLDFRDAVEVLAKRAGVEIPQEAAGGSGEDRRPLYEALENATAHYEQSLRNSEPAIDYLKSRGVSGAIAKQFRLGFAADGYDNLPSQIGPESVSLQAGLSARNDSGRSYARFRKRIMFPIRDSRGRVIAFGGRILPGGGDEKGAKYLNSPETPLFQKRHHLYGLYEARQAHKRLPRALVVEGYMDVVMLAQQGISYAVATLGTATTPEHLEWLFRNTDQIVFCFDGDNAGRRAAEKAMDHALDAMRDGRQISFLFLPDGEDPDSLVQAEGAAAFTARIDNAQPLSDLLIQQLIDKTDISRPEGQARLVELAREPLQRLQPSAFRQLLIQAIANKAGMSAQAVTDLLGGSQPVPKPEEQGAPVDGGVSRLRAALRILLEYPALATDVADLSLLQQLNLRGVAVLSAALNYFAANPAANAGSLIEQYRDDPSTASALQRLISNPLVGEEAEHRDVFMDAIRLLAKKARQQRIESLLATSRSKTLDEAETQELTRLLAESKDEAE